MAKLHLFLALLLSVAVPVVQGSCAPGTVDPCTECTCSSSDGDITVDCSNKGLDDAVVECFADMTAAVVIFSNNSLQHVPLSKLINPSLVSLCLDGNPIDCCLSDVPGLQAVAALDNKCPSAAVCASPVSTVGNVKDATYPANCPPSMTTEAATTTTTTTSPIMEPTIETDEGQVKINADDIILTAGGESWTVSDAIAAVKANKPQNNEISITNINVDISTIKTTINDDLPKDIKEVADAADNNQITLGTHKSRLDGHDEDVTKLWGDEATKNSIHGAAKIIDDEIARAISAEDTLEKRIDAVLGMSTDTETTDPKSVNGAYAAVSAERTRAMAAEADLQSNIDSLEGDASTIGTVKYIEKAVADEKVRAMNKENILNGQVTDVLVALNGLTGDHLNLSDLHSQVTDALGADVEALGGRIDTLENGAIKTLQDGYDEVSNAIDDVAANTREAIIDAVSEEKTNREAALLGLKNSVDGDVAALEGDISTIAANIGAIAACGASGKLFVGKTSANPSGCGTIDITNYKVPTGVTAACAAATKGALRINSFDQLEFCDGSAWMKVGVIQDGSSLGQSAASCSALKSIFSATSGKYWIQGTEQYCDMTEDEPKEYVIVNAANEKNPKSCAQILRMDPGRGSGAYYLRPLSTSKKVYCDMTDGGWTAVMKLGKNGFCYFSSNWRSSSEYNPNQLEHGSLPGGYDSKNRLYFEMSTNVLKIQTNRGSMKIEFVSSSTPMDLMTTNNVDFKVYPDYTTWRNLFGQDRADAPVFMRGGSAWKSGSYNSVSCKRSNGAPVGCGQQCVFCYQASDSTQCSQLWQQTGGPRCCNQNINSNDVSSGLGLNAAYCGGGNGNVCSYRGSWSTLATGATVWAR